MPPFDSVTDLANRVERKVVNRRVMMSLINIGAFDTLDADRNAVAAMYLTHIKVKEKDWPAMLDMTDTVAMYRMEKDLVGGFILYDPLEPYEAQIEKACIQTPEAMEALPLGSMKLLGGIITTLKVIETKKGDPMAFCTITYKSQDFEVIIFPDTWASARYFLKEDIPVIARVMRLEKGSQITTIENLALTEKRRP